MIYQLLFKTYRLLPRKFKQAAGTKRKKLDIDWLVLSEECLELTKEIKDNRQRPLIKCLFCSKYEMEVRKLASNGRVPLACGVRVDGKTDYVM